MASVTQIGGSELIRAKLQIPEPRAELVPRSHLLEELGDSSPSLLLVRAPAGYGKSTLLEQWARADGRRFAWVSLDPTESDPVLFWRYVFAALRLLEPDLADDAFRQLNGSVPDLLGSVVSGLLNALGGLEEPIVLVLDDYHRLGASPVDESLSLFVRHVPRTVTVALSSRSEPSMSLAGMRSRGLVAVIGADDLRFSRDETVSAVERFNTVLTTEDAERIYRSTEGWPVGIYLTSGTRDGSPSSREIREYVVSEMLDSFADDDRKFMAATSILDELNADLCDHVVGVNDSRERLERLSKSNLLFVEFDGVRDRFRYHHLLRDALGAELVASRAPDDIRLLHRKAFDWCRRRDSVSDAIHHAIQADLVDDAVVLVCANWYDFMMSGRLATAQRWLTWFSEADIRSHPPILVAGALVNGFAGDDINARRFAQMAAAASYDGDSIDGSATYESSVAIMQGALVLDGPADALAHVARATQIEPIESPYRPVLAGMTGVYRYMTGAKSGYYPMLIEGARATTGPPAIAAYALGNLALIHGWRGEWKSAAEYADEAIALIEDQDARGIVISGVAYAVAARVAAIRGDADEARRLLRIANGIERVAPDSTPFDSLVLRTAIAEALCALDEYGLAEATVGRALRNLSAMGDGGLAGERLDVIIRQINAARLSDEAGDAGFKANADSILSTRELQVLSLMATDLTLEEIGAQLYLSRNTVKTHTSRTYQKLGVHSREEALAAGRRLGYL